MFQLPIGAWPYPEGTRLRFKARPQWGVGTVQNDKGAFTVVWRQPAGTVHRWRYKADEWTYLQPERATE